MTNALLVLAAAVIAAAFASSRDKGSPLTWSLWLWVGVALIHVTRPLILVELNQTTTLAVAVGLAGLVFPMLKTHRPDLVETVHQGHRGVAFARFFILSGIVLVLVIVGVIAFRSGVSSALGEDYGTLSLQDVRAAQTTSARGGGLLGLLAALNPVAACLGIYGAYRYSRVWLLLTAVAAVATVQSPARINTLTLLVVVIVFWLYARNALSTTDTPTHNRLPLGRIMLAVGAGLAYFLYVGSLLSKNDSANIYSLWLPGWISSPIIYFSGGLSAFSVATSNGVAPIDFGSSVYWPMRVLNFFNPDILVPNTIALPVPAPMRFNVYSGFGQVYFDFGLLGVFIMCALLGWVAVVAHRKAAAGRMEWAFVAATTAALLFSLPQAYRLFNLDVAFQLVIGFFIFWAIRRSRRTTRFGVSERASRGVSARTWARGTRTGG